MSAELVHASVPKGLFGDSGFAVVAMTEGMPTPLVTVLKELSAYDFDPVRATGADEVDFGHRIVTAQGVSATVVSRIGPCGVDGSGRPNRIAHHIVVETHERGAGGPAALAAAIPFERTPGAVERRARGPALASAPVRAPRVPESWIRAGLDPGLAGLAARMICDAGSAPCYLVFDRPVDALPLIDDIIALLPEDRRWLATFSTRFLRAGPGVRCQLRCVREGAPGVAAMLAEPGARQLSCKPGVEAGDSEPAVAARAGRIVEGAARPAVARVEPVLRGAPRAEAVARSGAAPPAWRGAPSPAPRAPDEAPREVEFDLDSDPDEPPVTAVLRGARAPIGFLATVLFVISAVALIASAILGLLLALDL
jgi:hypothetical protein